MIDLIDDYDKVVVVKYRGEVYSVRDNGAVMRHAPVDRKARPLDNKWTFGTIDVQKGYKKMGDVPVHRIVATAFIGPAPSDKYVVDHIDTNKQNNRPENLRWLTRLENIIYNDITRTKVEYIFGCTIDDILKDVEILRSRDLSPQFEWMRTVSQEDADKYLKEWHTWCDERKKRMQSSNFKSQPIKIVKSTTDGIHPCEPQGVSPSLDLYYKNLKVNKAFYSRTYFGDRTNYLILKYYYNKEAGELYVASIDKEGLKPYYLTCVTIVDGKYEYETSSFFEEIGLNKYYTIAKGEEWTGGDCLDDYC